MDSEIIQIKTAPNPCATVIWLHGLGADGSDFESIVPLLGLKNYEGVRFLFPNAPHIPVTINNGYVSRAWYDILASDKNARKIDEPGLVASRERIRALMQVENQKGIPDHKIFLAGFSQGGAVAYFTALTHPRKLAGIVALSTYLPSTSLTFEQASTANLHTPIFVAHGLDDTVVSLEFGQQSMQQLADRGYRPEWNTYPIEHSVCVTEIRDIGRWLREHLRPISN